MCDNHKIEVVIRPLLQDDLTAADQVMRIAFGTLFGVPEPEGFFGDASCVANRWKADPSTAFAAELDGQVVGSNFATRWGSFAFCGPLTVRPDLWEHGIGSKLMEPIVNLFSLWGVQLAGLHTLAHSPKHLGIYQKFGFKPRYLTAVMSKSVVSDVSNLSSSLYCELTEGQKIACLEDCYSITDSLFEGLDLTSEIRAIEMQGLGDTILVWNDSKLVGFAACHQGANTEAGSGVCYIKFAAVRPDGRATYYFEQLLKACESFTASRSASKLMAGVNTARREAYETMLRRGFRTDIQGVAMHKPDESGFNRPGVYILDDWR